MGRPPRIQYPEKVKIKAVDRMVDLMLTDGIPARTAAATVAKEMFEDKIDLRTLDSWARLQGRALPKRNPALSLAERDEMYWQNRRALEAIEAAKVAQIMRNALIEAAKEKDSSMIKAAGPVYLSAMEMSRVLTGEQESLRNKPGRPPAARKNIAELRAKAMAARDELRMRRGVKTTDAHRHPPDEKLDVTRLERPTSWGPRDA